MIEMLELTPLADRRLAKLSKGQQQLTGIAHALIGQLFAIPSTPLYDRLKEEGRLDQDEEYVGLGTQTNVLPMKMTREEALTSIQPRLTSSISSIMP